MSVESGRWAGFCAAALLSGCAGVPQLYRPANTANPQTDLAPKVAHIVERITCELAGVSARQLHGGSYVITVLLTLQVNDELNLTPSLSFIDPLKVTGTNRTNVEGLGLGGARERSFTSSFSFDSDALKDQPACESDPRKLYRLDGHLGLADIARDGVGIGDQQVKGGRPSPPSPPSFTSSVKFVVTRAVNALGPTWTLVTFKGPGGANGLLNGKALNTDILNVAFAPKREAKPSPEVRRQIQLLEELVGLLKRRESDAALRTGVKRRALAAKKNKASLFGSAPAERARQQQAIEQASSDVAQAEQVENQTAAERARREIELTAAVDAVGAAAARSQAEAIRTGQELINTQILQNLNVQSR